MGAVLLLLFNGTIPPADFYVAAVGVWLAGAQAAQPWLAGASTVAPLLGGAVVAQSSPR